MTETTRVELHAEKKGQSFLRIQETIFQVETGINKISLQKDLLQVNSEDRKITTGR